jgi:glucose/arabinose dehydrogenase/chitodextrinase
MATPLGLLNQLTQRLVHRSSRHDRHANADSKHDTDHAPLIFETLEPRLLLAADPLGITAGYAFNEVSGTTAADASGHGIVGTLTNGPTFTAGKYGNAVTLDGVNDFVNLGNPTALRLTGSMTISAWVNISSFPWDDAAVVSKRTGETGFQLDITADTGVRTIGFKLTNSSGDSMFRYGATTLQTNTWYHIAGVYNAANQTLDVYLNGTLDNGQLVGTVTNSQRDSTANVNIGRRSGNSGFEFPGRIDDVRIADHALTQDQIQTDMATPLAAPGADTTPPTVSLTSPATIVSSTVSLAATASDNVSVVGVKFLLDGNTLIGSEDTTSPYGVSWNTTTASNGSHALTAQARDAANNITTSTAFTVTVDNQAPTGTVTINGGAAATNSTSVTLTLAATDSVTSVTQMRFSNNGTSYSTAEAFAPTKAWTLSNGAGTKTVSVQFRDAAGNWSTATTDTIVLDTTAPTISGQTATNITGNTAQINWTTNEAATSRVEYGLTTSYGSSTALDPTLATTHSVALTALAPNTTYNYRVRSIDAAGNERIGSNGTFTTIAVVDTTPPSTPTGLTATAISSAQINLSWNASTDNVAVTGYQIFRNGAQVGTSTTTAFSDTGLSPSTSYSYTVRAVDAAANPSAQSAPASTTTLAPDTTLPTATVTAPTGSAPLSGTITISASASDNIGVSGVTFLVDNVVVGGGEDTTAPYSVSWDSTTVQNGVHTIVARARDTSGNTGDSVPLSVTVSNAQPAGLVAAYSFDEGAGTTANDSSGQTNTATLNNGVAWVPGRYGKAASFDGVNDYITIPNSTSTNISGGALTLSMWINPQPIASGDSVVIGKFWNTTMTSPFYQYGLELRGGNQTDFYVGTTGGPLIAASGTTLPYNQWSYLTVSFDGAQVRTYVNGTLVNTQALSATITARGNPMNIGADASTAQFYKGMLDDLRIYNRVLTQAQIQTDMATPVGGTIAGSPQVSITFPASGSQVTGIVNVTANATDDTGIASVQFYVDNIATGSPDSTSPYALAWDTRTASNGAHTLTALATDLDGHSTLSAPLNVNVSNGNYFQNEVLATGFDLPTAIKFLPDGRMLVVELAGKIKVLPPPYTTPDPTPFLQLTNIGSAGVQQGIYDIALDPNFATNHYYYIFYTLGTPNVDRLSRFTANATLTGTVAGSEFVIYQDGETANAEHHGGAINFSNDGKILVTTGEHFNAGESQDLTKPRGKILRFNMDGTIPTDNPFYDGAGPNYDAIWALGLRNPYRAYYDAPTGRLIIGDVGGNVYSTAIEEVDIGARGANYGWPNIEAPTGNPAYTAPAYYYPHNGRDASITGGFVYHGTQFPSSYQGSYFFADYTQNWIKRLTFDANGNVNGVFNFEPADGTVDGPYGDIVYLTEGPDGALYYVDLGYSDISGTFGVSKIRRIEYIQSDLPPVAAASATPTRGPTPLTVNFSSSGSSDPEGHPLTYSWNFGDGVTSTQANPSHTYAVAGPYQARLTVSDGVNSTLSTPIAISVGNSPAVSILAPTDAALFKAGDVITFSGTATDIEDGTLPASAYTWNIDFLHEGHVHPGIPITGVTSGTFTIPTSGHDFSGFTRYRITLTVTDSSGLQSSQFVTVFPDKVNLTFDTAPGGLTLYLDGIAHNAPFVYDTLKGFNHTIEARDQTVGTTSYAFASWTDGGARLHTITVPTTAQTYTASFTTVVQPVTLAAAYAFNETSGTTAADASGHGITGTLTNGPTFTPGRNGNAITLDGVNDYVNLGNPPALQLTGSMTISAWVYIDSFPWDDAAVVSKRTGDTGFQLDITPDTGARTIGFKLTNSSGDSMFRYGATMLQTNTWYHIAGVYNATTQTLDVYLNGTLDNGQLVGTVTSSQQNSTANVTIGRRSGMTGFEFAGRIDDVRIYSSALTKEQIAADMGAQVS